jgi:hypothetical protein
VVDPTETDADEAIPTTVTDGALINVGAKDGETTYIYVETDTLPGASASEFTGS